jgi:hypothetical protein
MTVVIYLVIAVILICGCILFVRRSRSRDR